MSLERRHELISDTKEAIKLIIDIWDNQDSLLISSNGDKVIYIHICDDLNDNYHGQGRLFRSKDFSSIHCFMPTIRDEFKNLINNRNNNSNTINSYKNIINELNKFDPNLL